MRQIHRSLLSAAVMVGMGSAALAVAPRLVERPAVAGDAIPELLRGQELRPLSLAAADFDGDGVPDLAAGFGTPEGGVLVLYSGNVDALYPNSPEARQRRAQGSSIGEPFLPMDRVLVLTAPPDFLFAGDFDADGNADLAGATREGSAIHLLSGDGTGGFLPERRVSVPGGVTAMVSGDLGRRDGLPDLAVLAGSQALVFQTPEGALSAAPSAVRLLAPATSIAVGDFSAEHRRRVALRGEDGRVLLLQSDAPRSWRLVEAEPQDESDSQAAVLAPRTQSSFADAAAVLAMRVHSDEPSGEVVLKEDGTLSVFAEATLSTFVVDVTTDLADMVPGNGICADVNGDCSLRAAVQEANALAGADTITFAIPGASVPAIPLGSLPIVTEAVTIDGTTQPAGRVALTGTSNATLLTLAGGSSVVRGMVLNGSGSFGLKLQSNDNVVEGNFFGTSADGTALQGNLGVALINVVSGVNNRIGGTAASARNVVAGGSTAIRLDGGTTVIEGNYLGTDVTGTLDFGSAINGVRAFTASDNTIGGAVPGAGNLISGQNGDGIWLDTPGNLVQGNRVGVDATGNVPLPNSGSGIVLNFASSATLGGTVAGAGNLISGNGDDGLRIFGNAIVDVVVEGNRIGTNAAGSSAISNQGYGIRIIGASGVRIGGTSAASRNVISGSLFDGIVLTNFSTVSPDGTIIQGNYIGTDATGTVAIPNLQSGVSLQRGENTQLGGTTPGAGNVISGNFDYGVTFPMVGGLTHLVRGNFIGTNAFGTGPLGNGKGGVFFPLNTYCVVGGTGAGEQNRIAFNAGPGVVSGSGRAVHLKPNSIHSNGGLGIDVGNDGVTPNRPGAITNNFPVVTLAEDIGGGTSIAGTLSAQAATSFEIYLYSSTTCDPSGYGEGREYHKMVNLTTDVAGLGVFATTVTPAIPGGRYVTAYAVAPGANDNTSEFSFCRQIAGGPPPEDVPLELFAVTPPRGGNTGLVTLQIAGQGMVPGAAARLEKAGSPDEVATDVAVTADGYTLTATFDLDGAAEGAWDVTVTIPGDTSTLAAAFTIEEGTVPEIWADIMGRGTLAVRAGRAQRFFLVYGNRGNVDSPPALLRVSIPWQLRVTSVEPIGGAARIVSQDLPMTTGGTGRSEIWVYAPVVPGGSSTTVAFELLTIAAQPGEYGEDVTIDVKWTSSAEFEALFQLPLDPGVGAVADILVNTPSHLEATVHVSNGIASGDLHFDLIVTEVGYESDAVHRTVSAGGNLEHHYQVAFRLAPDEPPLLFEAVLEGPEAVFALARDGVAASEALRKQTQESGETSILSAAGVLDAAQTAELGDRSAFATALETVIAAILPELPPGLVTAPTGQYLDRAYIDALKQHAHVSFTDKIYEAYLNDPVTWNSEFFPGSVIALPKSREELFDKLVDVYDGDIGEKARVYHKLKIYISIDPNEKAGPSGAGDARYVTGQTPLAYTLTFENLETATAAAQEVVVTDQLDGTKLDLSTFELGPIAFGTRVVTVPPGLTSFTGDVDLRPGVDLVARVSAEFNAATGLATWHFFSLDPATGQPTEDPILGFLPPNVATPEGEGHVTFTIGAKPGLASGTEIHNQASIVFDANPPIVTADWFNTIDVTQPSSQVAGLSAPACSGIEVQWSGNDAHSGILEYDIFVSENGGAFAPWLLETAETAATFHGEIGSSYAFFSVARDAAGNEEAPGSADATTTVTDPTPLIDLLEPDSGPASGAAVVLTGSGFEAGASVSVGGLPASGVVVNNATSMTASFPALSPGALYDVAASNASTCSDTLLKGWLADFGDVPGAHGFHDFIEKIFRRSVTAGCSGGNYCPDNPVTRAQMAVFLIKAKYNLSLVPPAATGTLFADVPVGSFAADWIEQLANEGVTGGCGGGNYCPGNSVTRAQMAVFLLKSEHGALYVPPAATGVFADVPPGSFAADWIEQLAAEGITGGCGGGNYCPNNPVTRGQMAVFLSKTFGF